MRILATAALLSLTLGCNIVQELRGDSSGRELGDQAADAGGALPDGASLALDAAPSDAFVAPDTQTCTAEQACGEPGSFTVCEYEAVHGHVDRTTKCTDPTRYETEPNPILSYTCGACPADPVCDEPCFDDVALTEGTVQCFDDWENDGPRTVCRAESPVFGDDHTCGACPGQPWTGPSGPAIDAGPTL